MTHIFVGKLTIIGSDKGLSPGRRQSSDGILLIGPVGTNLSKILSEIHTFTFMTILSFKMEILTAEKMVVIPNRVPGIMPAFVDLPADVGQWVLRSPFVHGRFGSKWGGSASWRANCSNGKDKTYSKITSHSGAYLNECQCLVHTSFMQVLASDAAFQSTSRLIVTWLHSTYKLSQLSWIDRQISVQFTAMIIHTPTRYIYLQHMY